MSGSQISGALTIAQNQPDNRSARFFGSCDTGSAPIRATRFGLCLAGGTSVALSGRRQAATSALATVLKGRAPFGERSAL